MQLRQVPQQNISLGTHQTADGQKFKLAARLLELPRVRLDYWQATYDAEHDRWGCMRFVLTVPKKSATTLDFARAIVVGVALDQVKVCLGGATGKGRDMAPCFALDGWVLA